MQDPLSMVAHGMFLASRDAGCQREMTDLLNAMEGCVELELKGSVAGHMAPFGSGG